MTLGLQVAFSEALPSEKATDQSEILDLNMNIF